jgi:hypothetical protein
MIWWHALAIGFSPTYQTDHADGISKDWPRIPLPPNAEIFRASANLGRAVAALLDPDTPMQGVTAGNLSPTLREIARLRRADGTPVQTDAGDLGLTAGWGYRRAGTTMPGRGRINDRNYTETEEAAIGDSATELGTKTFDLWLNDRAIWQNLPVNVWEYTVGGYQVLKKWLSYRERELLARDLTPDEARTFTQLVRRIAAILLLEPQLDASYQAAAAATANE